MSAHPKQVKQGEQILIDVTINPAPNVAGRLYVFASPVGEKAMNYSGAGGISPGKTQAELGINIPIDGKLGEWKVEGVRFQPENSPEKELTISGNINFEVVKRETILPSTADVQVK
ncbi:MAG TPA: hypothetical protein VFA90_14770 [Terriglobales bacterium]|nr:hypothetical protein [Terriglobales bacterium]